MDAQDLPGTRPEHPSVVITIVDGAGDATQQVAVSSTTQLSHGARRPRQVVGGHAFIVTQGSVWQFVPSATPSLRISVAFPLPLAIRAIFPQVAEWRRRRRGVG